MQSTALAPSEQRRRPFGDLASSQVGAVAQTIVSNAIIMGCGALGSVLSARLLGPGGRGELAAVVTWASMAAALADIGVSQACIYYGAKNHARAATILGTALALGVSFALVAVCCILPFRTRFVGSGLAGSVALYLFSIPLGVIATYTAAVLLGMNRVSTCNSIKVVQACAYVAGTALAILFGRADVGVVLLAIAGCQCCATCFAVVTTSRVLALESWRVNKRVAGELLAYGSRSYAGNLFWLANGRLDQAVLALFVPMRELGAYAVAVSYSAILFGLAAAFASVLFPRVAAARVGGGRREVRVALWGLLGVSVPLGATMALASSWVIPRVFGQAFVGAVKPAYILLVGALLLGVNYVLHNALKASGRPGAPAIAEAIGLVVTVSALPAVLPRWGIVGAAWVSVVSYTATAAGLGFLWKHGPASQRLRLP